MSWQSQWQVLSHRIGGFLEAVKVFVDLFQMTKDESISGKYYLIKNVLLPEAKDVMVAVDGLCEAYKDVLPTVVREVVQRYSSHLQSISDTSLTGLFWAAMILAAMKNELDYLLADQEAAALAIVERAFMHLQRTIVVDQDQRNRWVAGFKKKETQCEQMGATHLLWHGIWAFKVDAKGERTDLVLECPIGELVERIRTSGSRLVLTEWKRVWDRHGLESATKEAMAQLMLYSQGSLAGIELRSARYAVIVSQKHLTMPPDQTINNNVTIRFVNIVVDPKTPSKASSS